MVILDTLAPVFLVIGLGAALQRFQFLPRDFLKDANKLAYWVGLPALLIHDLADSPLAFAAAGSMLGVTIGGCLSAVVVAYLVVGFLKLPPTSVGTFVQGSFRGNLAFMGLPIIAALPDATLPNGISTRSAALLVIGPVMVLYNILGVTVLLLSQHAFGFGVIKPFLKQLMITPPLVASVLGIALAETHTTLPGAVNLTLKTLGEMALPLGMLGIGGALVTSKVGANWRPALVAALIKTAIVPLCGIAIARVIGMPTAELRIVLVFLAAPTAIISYPMVVELKGDLSIAAGAIVFSTLISIPILALVVSL